MDYAEISLKLSNTARDQGDVNAVYEPAEMVMAYHSAACQRVRMRFDLITLGFQIMLGFQITLDFISPRANTLAGAVIRHAHLI
jgi:hypothetical protein